MDSVYQYKDTMARISSNETTSLSVSSFVIGIEDKTKSKNALEKHLKSLDYSFVEETDNTAYKEFLR